MPVPTFQALMLPVLQTLGGGQERSAAHLRVQIAQESGLTSEDLAHRIPSARRTTFASRVGWAATYLKEAGLIRSVRRGVFQITERGTGVLATGPEKIDIPLLKQYESFVAFRYGRNSREVAVGSLESRPVGAGAPASFATALEVPA